MTNSPPNFLIVCDIDGVLIHDNCPIPASHHGFQELLKFSEEMMENAIQDESNDSNTAPDEDDTLVESVSVATVDTNTKETSQNALNHISKHFFCLTNGGGQTEEQRARIMGELFGMDEFFHEERIFLAHTVIGRHFLEEYRNKRILVVARDPMGNVLEHYGFQKITYIWEFLERHPYLCPYSSQVQKEFGRRSDEKHENYVPVEELWKEEPIEAIMVLQNPTDWNDASQVICDLLVSDGRVGCNKFDGKFDFYPAPTEENDKSSESPPPPQMPLIFCNPDLTYAGEFKSSRFTQGAFKIVVQSLFKALHGREIENIHQFGKPLQSTYDFIKSEMKKHLGVSQLPERIYMIGDNPKSDIAGAIGANFHSILVRTGCFRGDDNDPEHPADHVCENFHEAIGYILEREKGFGEEGKCE